MVQGKFWVVGLYYKDKILPVEELFDTYASALKAYFNYKALLDDSGDLEWVLFTHEPQYREF